VIAFKLNPMPSHLTPAPSYPAGKRVAYLWEETSGRLPAGSFNATKSTLAVKVGGAEADGGLEQHQEMGCTGEGEAPA